METPTREQMVADGIRYVFTKKETYFSVDDVLKKYPDYKIHPANVYSLDYEGTIIPTVKASDIEPKSDFEKMMDGSRMFKPK